MNRLANSWELLKASASVLRADKELLLFPILSSIGVMIVTLSFAIPFMLTDLLGSFFSESTGSEILTFLVLFLFYIVQYFVVIFSNSALIGAASIRLQGGDPTVSDGFRIAFKHIGSIFAYAVISSTVGIFLKMISQRSNNLGRFVVSLIGLGWNIATFLVIPILVIEGINPIEAIKRSVSLLKKTWGEQIAGNLGIGLIFTLLTLGLLVVAIPIIVISFVNEIYWLGITLIVGLVFSLILLGLVQGALNGIYIAAVYRYTVKGDSGTFFTQQQVQQAFRTGR
jgi:hypothetical protein